MKILQFAFYDDDAEYLPRMYPHSNCVVYSGSHDADCTKSWINNLSEESVKARFKKECPSVKGQSRTYDVIELAMRSTANLAVIPMQDYLELTNEEGRMNTPAVAEGNWNWRISAKYRTKALTAKVLGFNERSGRATK
jgi:4-alpha-glucanotransferase